MKTKLISIISNWKTVITTVMVTLGGIVWLLDVVFITENELNKHNIARLYDDIETMEVIKGYNGDNQLQLYEMLVELKKNRIKKLEVK